MHAVAEHAVLRVTPEGLVPLFVSAGTFGVLGQEPWRRVLVGNREARTLIALVLAIVYRTTCVTRAQYYVLGPETVRHTRIHVTNLPDRAVSAWPILFVSGLRSPIYRFTVSIARFLRPCRSPTGEDAARTWYTTTLRSPMWSTAKVGIGGTV